MANSRTGQSRYKMNLHYPVTLDSKEEQKHMTAGHKDPGVRLEGLLAATSGTIEGTISN